MAHLIGVFRIGEDAVLRYTSGANPKPIVELTIAHNFGRRDDHGNRKTQWSDVALLGQRAADLAPVLLKGRKVYLLVSEIHVDEYKRGDGSMRTKLSGLVLDIELIDKNPMRQANEDQQAEA